MSWPPCCWPLAAARRRIAATHPSTVWHLPPFHHAGGPPRRAQTGAWTPQPWALAAGHRLGVCALRFGLGQEHDVERHRGAPLFVRVRSAPKSPCVAPRARVSASGRPAWRGSGLAPAQGVGEPSPCPRCSNLAPTNNDRALTRSWRTQQVSPCRRTAYSGRPQLGCGASEEQQPAGAGGRPPGGQAATRGHRRRCAPRAARLRAAGTRAADADAAWEQRAERSRRAAWTGGTGRAAGCDAALRAAHVALPAHVPARIPTRVDAAPWCAAAAGCRNVCAAQHSGGVSSPPRSSTPCGSSSASCSCSVPSLSHAAVAAGCSV